MTADYFSGSESAEGLGRVLKSTSFLTVTAEGSEPATILVLEEGMAQKPSILLNLTIADILRCWSALTPEQKAVLPEDRYQELGQAVSALLPRGPLGKHELESLFDAFAGAFHAFASLERKLFQAIKQGRNKEAEYLLFGKKYDSLPRLLDRLAEGEDRIDAVHRYVLLLCARQVLDRVKRQEGDFAGAHRREVGELEQRLEALDAAREALALEPAGEKRAFLEWYESWFLKRAEPQATEQP